MIELYFSVILTSLAVMRRPTPLSQCQATVQMCCTTVVLEYRILGSMVLYNSMWICDWLAQGCRKASPPTISSPRIFPKDNRRHYTVQVHTLPFAPYRSLLAETGKSFATMNAALRAVTRVAPRAIARQSLASAFKPLSTPSELFAHKSLERNEIGHDDRIV